MSTKKLSLSPSKWYLPYYFIPHLLLAFPLYAAVIFMACIILFSPEGVARSGEAEMDTALVYGLSTTAIVLGLFILNTLLYVFKTSIEISEDSFIITKGGLWFERHAIPLTLFAANNLTQHPYQLLFGLTTFRIGIMEQHQLPGFNYKAAMQFGLAMSSGGERASGFSSHSSFSKTTKL
jgi:hypothetical protein